MTSNKCDFSGDPCDDIKNNSFSSNNISSSNIYNNSMSDPSNTSKVSYPSYSFQPSNVANPNTLASTASSPSSTSNASVNQFFTLANAKKEWYAALPEIVVVFGLSFGISLYMGDEIVTALERGSFMALGQYTAQIAVDMMPKPISDTQVYLYDAEKFAIATSIFIGGNKYILGSEQPIQNLLIESAVASIVAHYSYNATQKAITSASSVASQYSHLY